MLPKASQASVIAAQLTAVLHLRPQFPHTREAPISRLLARLSPPIAARGLSEF